MGEPDEDLQSLQLGRERGFETARRGYWVHAAIASDHARAVRPDRGQAANLELARGQRALVDLQRGDAPRIVRDRSHAISQQLFVVAILLLKMVLTKQQPLGPDGLGYHDRSRFGIAEPQLP